MKRLTAVVAGAIALATASTVAAHSSSGCAATDQTRNSWHPVRSPARDAHIVNDDTDACAMYAASPDGRVWASADGGIRWRARGSVATGVRQLVRAGLPQDVLIAVPDGPGLRISRDAGRSWVAAGGIADVVVTSVAVDPDDRASIWAAGSHGAAAGGAVPTGSVFMSTDAGASWTESTGGLALHPGALARLGAPYSNLFAADSRTHQLWQRSDQDAFTPVYADDVHSLAVSPLKGGGSQLYAAGAAGVAVTKDGGTTFRLLTSNAATAVAAEYQHFTAFMFVSGGIFRTTNAGGDTRAVNAGLPSSCHPSSLTSDRENPSTFLTVCSDGSTWRWRSDGSDPSDTDTIDSGDAGTLGVLPTATPMKLLRKLRLPQGGDSSAAIAFDGTYLYYTLHSDTSRVHRLIAATGRPAPDVVFSSIRAPIIALTYDSRRHLLYLADANARTWVVSLRTLRVRKLFDGPYSTLNGTEQPWGSMSYDASVDEFVFTNDSDNQIHWYNRLTGAPTHTCTTSSVLLGPTTGTAGFASIAASGDGDVYAGDEDDTTIYRVDSQCHVTAAFTHAFLDEAPDENDAMACDTVTFSEPAIWMRDAPDGVAYAYAVPGGYCALATRLTVTAPAKVTTGSAGSVCARLVRAGTGAAIVGQPVQLFVASRPIGSPSTDAAGRACASYRPTAAETGRRLSNAAAKTTQSRLVVLGSFLGTIAYRPASAQARLLAIDLAPPPPPPPPVQSVGAAPGSGPQPAAVPPAIIAPPPPPAPPAGQVQPLPQAHPGAQGMAQGMAQPGAAPQPDEQARAATAEAQRDEFRARDASELGVDLRVVLPAGVLLAAVVARRRRASRVRGQPS